MKQKNEKFDAVKALRGNKTEPRAIQRSDGTKLGGTADSLDALQDRVIRQLTGELDSSKKKSSARPLKHVAVRRLDDPTNQPKRTKVASLQEAVEAMLSEEQHEEQLLDDDPCEYDSWTEEV